MMKLVDGKSKEGGEAKRVLVKVGGQRGLAPPQFVAEMARFTIEPRQIE